MRNIFLLLIATSAICASAQDFTITMVELEGDKVNLYYDLADSVKSRAYTIALYSSKDDFVSKLEKVSGDIGLEVKPGNNRKIVWDAKTELGTLFEGKIGLEVRGRVYIPFVRLEGLNRIYKRGKGYPITWTGGTQQNILNFDLYKGDEKIFPFSNIANVGQTTIEIPNSVKPGKGYYFKITDNKNKDQMVNSQTFTIKRKTPLLLKMLPILAVGGIATTLGGSSENGTKDIPEPLPPTVIK